MLTLWVLKKYNGGWCCTKRTRSSMKCRIDVPHLGSRTLACWLTCRASPWCPPRCPSCRSAGRRARPQVWHINPAFHTWPGSFGAGPRSLECNLTIFSLWETSWNRTRSGGSWEDPERKKTDSTPWHQQLGILWLTLKRNPPQNTRKGPWDPPQNHQFSLFHKVKSQKM